MRHTLTIKNLSLLVLGLTLTACDDTASGGTVLVIADAAVDSSSPDMSAPDAQTHPDCDSNNDGICDEPSRCPLGTDETDCVTACEEGESLAFFAAACHHRGLLEPVLRIAERDTATRVNHWIDETVPAVDDEGRMAPRHVRLFIPPGLSAQSAPLVLMLPGNRVSHYNLADYTQLDSTATANGFIVGYVEQPWRSRTFSWSWYTDWDWANSPETNPDLALIRTLVEHLTGAYPIDPSRVYLAGHSRGAAMSVIAALEMPDIIAGAVPQSGFVEFGYFDRVQSWRGQRKPAFYFMHGALDDDVCIDCIPNGRCGVIPVRQCGSVAASDALVAALRDLGWSEDKLSYARVERAAHRWQPWLNQTWWDFISRHSTSDEEQTP